MRRVETSQLQSGDRLGQDVYTLAGGLPLLRAGVRISDSYRQALERSGILAVWIDDGLSEGIEPLEVVGDATKARANAAIRDALKDVSRTFATGGTLPAATIEEIKAVAEMIVSDIAANIHSALALNDLASADGYTLKHSLAVTTIGLSLGLRVMRKYGWIDAEGFQRYDRIEDRLVALGTGLLLHDIGKLAVPDEILQKAGPLDEAEWQAMRTHPTAGVQILQKAEGISPLSRAVVRSHHERWDGSGYPDGISGDDIHQFARIAAVADVFDALTSERSYRSALPMDRGCDFIVNRSGTAFDPQVVDVFQSVVAPYPPGSGVVLSDGSHALVKQVRQHGVRRPIVRVVTDASGALVTPREVDLSRVPDLSIVSAGFQMPVTAPA
jgi:HD-GYP domain-containing protein (c-di-GMP phosphodiesterase class II)